MKSISHRLHCLHIPLLLCALLAATNTFGANGLDTWTGANNTAGWDDPNNWTGVNDPPLAGDTLAFDVTVGSTGTVVTNDYPTTTNFYGLTFNVAAPSYSIYGIGFTNTGALVDNSPNVQVIDLPIILGVTTNITVASGGSLTISNIISGGFGFTNNGPGLLTLAASNTFTGPIAITAGTVTVNAAGLLNNGAYGGAISNTAAFNLSATNAQTLSGAITNTGAITLNGTNTERLSGTINNGGTISVSGGPGTQTLSGTMTNTGTITFNNPATSVMSGTYYGNGPLNQNGTGTLSVTGNMSAYTGALSVNSGELLANTGVSFVDTVTVATGATNGVQVNGNAVNGTAGQTTFSSLIFNSGTTYALFNFAVSPNSATAPLLVTNLTLTGTPAILVTGNAAVPAGQYPLIKYVNLVGTAPTSLTVTISGVIGTLVNNTGNSSFDLLVAPGQGNQVTWNTNSGTWNTSAHNWLDGSATTYTDGEYAVFPDTQAAGGTIQVTLSTTVNPTNVMFNDSVDNYAIIGSGTIGGVGSLVKDGLGLLTLTNNELNSGGVILNAGTATLDFTGGATNNILNSNASLTLGGATLNIIGNASGLSTQSVTNTTFSSGVSIINLAGTTPTLNLSNMTEVVGGMVEFVGPATIGAGGVAVPATGTVTTTSAGGGGWGLIGGNGSTTADYATVGLYDWATTFTTAGTAGTAPYTIIGGSQAPGFYNPFGTGNNTLASNVDFTAGTSGSHNTDTIASIRFNVAGGCVWSPGSVVDTGGILVTPNVGAANVSIAGTAGEVEPSRTASSATSIMTIWQNNTNGFFIGNVNDTLNDGKSPAIGTYVFGGISTIEFNFPNTYSGVSYIDGNVVMYMPANYLGNPAVAATLALNGGTVMSSASFALDNGSASSAHPIVLGNNGGGLAAATATVLTVDGVVNGAAGTGPLVIGIPASANNGGVLGQLPGTGTGTANTTPVLATGTVVLSGANNVTGGTVLDSGILNVASTASLPTGGITFNGGTFQWLATTPDISAQKVTVTSLGGVLDVNNHVVSLANGIGNGGSGGLTVASTVTGGTLNLNGANTYTGLTTISGGATLGGSGSLGGGVTALTSANFSMSGNIGGALTLNSGATATLTALASSHQVVTGTATFNGNSVTVNIPPPGLSAGNTYTILSASSVSGTPVLAGETGTGVQAGQTFTLGTTATTVTLTVGSTGTPATWTDGASTGLWSTPGNWTVTAGTPPPKNPGDSATFGTGASPVDLNVSETVGAMAFTNATSYTISEPGGTTLTLDNSGKGATINVTAGTANIVQAPVSLNDNLTTTVAAGGSVALAGNVSSTGTSETVTVKGQGTTVLSGANTYGPAAGTTGTTLTGGAVLQLGNSSALGAGDLSASSSSTIQEGAAGLAVANNIVMAVGNTTVDNNGGKSATLTGTLSGVGGLMAVNSAAAGTAGILTLAPTSGANTYTGPTVINGGTVSIAADTDLGAVPGSATLNSIILNGGDLLVNTSGVTLNANRGIGIGSTSAVNSATTNGYIDGTTSLLVDGNIAGAGNKGVNNLVFNGNGGSGTVALYGVSTYNGNTVIGAGSTLELDVANALSGPTLKYDTGTLTFNTITTASIGELSSDPGFTSQVLTLVNTGASPVALTVGGNGTSSIFYGGLNDNSTGASLTKVGAGTLILAGSNFITGNTTISLGILEVTNGGILNDAAMNGAELWVAGGAVTNTGNTGLAPDNNAIFETGGSFSGTSITVPNTTDGAGIMITGGSFTCNTMDLQRCGYTAGTATIAAPIPGLLGPGAGLYINGPTANVNFNSYLYFGDSSSATTVREDNGTVTVGGEVEVGNDTSGGRFSVLQINGGTFTNLDAANGIVICAGGTAGSDSEVYLSGGVTSAQVINFGTSGGGANEGLLIVTNAKLYLGGGGMAQPNTSQTSLIGLISGTLGATASWTSASTLTNQLGAPFTFQTADGSGNPWNITLGGPVVNIPGYAGTVVAAGGGTLFLGSPYDTYTGGTVISNGATLNFVAGGLGTGGVTFYHGTMQWGTSTTTDVSSQSVTIGVGGATLDMDGNVVTLANSIGNGGAGALTITNSSSVGSISLNSASGNNYTGGTTVAGGTLIVNNTTGSGTGSGNVTVETGATLEGSGTITGNVEVQNGATLAPGSNSVGTLTTGALTLDSGAIVTIQFPVGASAEVVSSGTLTLNDGDLFNLFVAGSAVPWTLAGTYPLIHYTGTAPVLDSTWTTSSATNPHIINPQTVTCLYSFTASGGVLSLKITAAANSASSEWTNTLGGNWSVAGNWSPNKTPQNAGDQATFGLGGAGITTVGLNANESVGQVTFNNANSFVIANDGHLLTLDNTGLGVIIFLEDGNANQIQAPVALNDNVTNVLLAGASLKFSGNISNSANGSFSMAANGAGTLSLSGVNSYGPSAGTAPSQYGTAFGGGGTLQVGNSSALGAGDVGITSSSTVQATASVNLANNIDVAPNATATVDSQANNLTLSGTVEDSGALTKIGSGTLVLGGANTFTGPATVDAGIMSISADDNLGGSVETPVVLNGGDLLDTAVISLARNVNIGPATGSAGTNALIDAASGVTFTIPDVIGSSGNLGVNGLIVNSEPGSTGIVELEGANTYGGTTVISNGTLLVGLATTLADSTVNLNNPVGTLSFDANQSITAATLGGLTGAYPLWLTNTAAAPITLSVGANNASTTYAGGLNDAGLGGALTKVGTGTLTLTGSNYYTGTTTGSAGTLEITNGGVLNVGVIAGAGYLVDGGILTNSSASDSFIGSAANTFLQTAGTVNVGELTQNYGGTADFLFQIRGGLFISANFNMGRGTDGNQYPTAPTATVPIAAATTLGLYIDSTNTASPAQVYLGRLSIASANGANSDSSVRLSAGNLTVTNEVLIGNQATTGRWTLMQVSGGNFTNLDTANGIVIAQNTVAANDSELYLSGGNTYAQLIQFGTFADTDAGGNGFLIISTNASLYLGAGGILSSNTVGFTSTISLLGGTLGATANWSTTNAILLEGGTNTILAGDPSGNSWNIGLSGILSGPAGLVKTGPGVLTLSGVNTYAGVTTLGNGIVNAGVVESAGVGGPLGLSAASNPGSIVFTGGTLQYSVVNNNDYSGRFSTAANQLYSIDTAGQTVSFATALTSSSGSLTKLGAGTLQLSAANTYTGSTTISNGTLLLTSTGSLANSTNISIAAGATFNTSSQATFTLGSTASLTASGTINAAGIAGAGINLGSRPIILNYDGSHPALTISAGTLSLNGNAFTINSPAPLAAGNYTVVTQAVGNITTAGSYTVTGTALGSAQGTITVTGGKVILNISAAAPTITFTIVGNNNTLNLSWPAGDLGASLLYESNSVGVGLQTNAASWLLWPGSTGVTSENIPISKTNEMFFQLYIP